MIDKKNEVKEIRILVLEPGKAPEVRSIPNTLECAQEIVGGLIQIVSYDSRYRSAFKNAENANSIVVVCNEEGKLQQLPMNRVLLYGNTILDVYQGTIFICGVAHGDFVSLSDDQVKVLEHVYHEPDQFLRTPYGVIWVNDRR